MVLPNIDHLFLITGTTRGIGKALVSSALAQSNTFVVSLSRDVSFIRNNHQNIHIDLSHTERLGSVLNGIQLDQRQANHLTSTVLINNAGVIEPISPISDCEDSLLARNIQVNLIAPLILTRHFFHFSKVFAGQKWVVNISSGASKKPYYGWSAYGAAKAGLDMAAGAMALEFAQIDPAFRICTVAPGTVDTAMQEKIRTCTTHQFQQVAKFLKLKESSALYTPEQVASTLMRLLMEMKLENGGRYDLREMEGESAQTTA